MNPSPDKAAFLQLIQENKAILFKISNSYCHNEQDREDLVQEIIFQLWKSGHSFQSERRFTTWMYRVALNVAISFYRKKSRTTPTLSLTEHVMEIEDHANGNDSIEENLRLLQQFIHELPELDRALMLLYLEEKSYSEIAEILGISETNVATKISRIKGRLKQRFTTIIQ
ncbi:MAG: RNA polymerase sigma factor [Chitinophagaceae bacterium]